MNTLDTKYQQKPKSISSAEPNYFVHFAMRYPVIGTKCPLTLVVKILAPWPLNKFFCLKDKNKKIRGILCNCTWMQSLLHSSSSKDEQKHLFFHFKCAKTSWQIAQEKTVYFQGANIHRFYLHPHIWFFRCYSEFLGMELVKKRQFHQC